jgi:hypothetical protein
MKTLDLCVIADRFCATSRTYLTYLEAAGYRPRKILLVDFIGPHQPSRDLAQKWGRRIASFSKQKIRLPVRDHASDFKALCDQLQDRLPLRVNYFEPFDFASKAEKIAQFTAENYDDPDLHRRIARERAGTFLYTNGGRVPASLLDRPGLRILHIHPGVVPEVKGSDCLFWSMLTRGRPGMSCFYMNAGIDTGDIILTREFDPPLYPQLNDIGDTDLAYRALLHAYDPHLRAQTLLDIVKLSPDGRLGDLPSTRQAPGAGRSYFWMHPRLVAKALRLIANGVQR